MTGELSAAPDAPRDGRMRGAPATLPESVTRGRPPVVAAERRARVTLRVRSVVERRLRGGEAGDRHAVRRARHVVEPGAMAERDRARLAAVLAADADLEAGTGAPPFLDGDRDEL